VTPRETIDVEVPGWIETLPAVNAGLNGLATALLIAGYVCIRREATETHKRLMLTAFGTSILFLVCYLTYHFGLQHYTGSGSRSFPGTGGVRIVYLSILITHIILAAAVPFLACITIYRGLKSQWEQHRKIARITFPIWLYVSVTGVVIYAMLYHWAVPN
jgi:protein SCO1/2